MEILLPLVAFVLIIIIFKVVASDSVTRAIEIESVKIRENLKIQGELYHETYIKYCGGHPSLTESGAFKINVYEDDIVIYKNNVSQGIVSMSDKNKHNNGDGVVIKAKDIISVKVTNQSHITNDPKLSSVVLLGVAGLAVNNTTKSDISYLDIEYKHKDKNYNLILSSDVESELGSMYNKAIGMTNGLNRMVDLSNSINKASMVVDREDDMVNIFQNN